MTLRPRINHTVVTNHHGLNRPTTRNRSTMNHAANPDTPSADGSDSTANADANTPPTDPLAAILWHTDGIDGLLYDEHYECPIGLRILIATELAGIVKAQQALAARTGAPS